MNKPFQGTLSARPVVFNYNIPIPDLDSGEGTYVYY